MEPEVELVMMMSEVEVALEVASFPGVTCFEERPLFAHRKVGWTNLTSIVEDTTVSLELCPKHTILLGR